jgi:hypothetical protein
MSTITMRNPVHLSGERSPASQCKDGERGSGYVEQEREHGRRGHGSTPCGPAGGKVIVASYEVSNSD